MDATFQFASSLPTHGEFRSLFSGSSYTAVPDDWLVAVTDVVGSRKAIAAGKYKAVNVAGVAAISAIMNALGHQSIPYVFGGDGSAMVCSPEQESIIREVLARTISWAADETGLQLRAALVPVMELQKRGLEVKVASVKVSDAVSNFAFTGGGIGAAEAMMKAGEWLVERAPIGEHPDLTGLSCRWMPVRREQSAVVSLIVEPPAGRSMIEETVAEGILSHLRGKDERITPIPDEGPDFAWPPKGLDLEARATRGKGSLAGRKVAVLIEGLIGWILGKTGISLGSFDPVRYRKYTGLNTDYRKVQDGLRLTVCITKEQLSALKTHLERQRTLGNIRYGISEQDQAVLTCFVPSVTDDNHLHFLDGAGGGYAEAASNLQ